MILDLYQQYGIDTAQPGHKHYRPGWVNIQCPYCAIAGSDGYHLGFNLDSGYFYCWRCGSHPVKAVLARLLKLHSAQVEEILINYRLKQRSRLVDAGNASKLIKIGKRKFKYPSEVNKMKPSQSNYLAGRGFDPEYLEEVWKLKGTSPFSVLDKISYKFRILLPIIWKDREVSFQCRDYTDKQAIKYMACPEEREIAHHKHILYGHPSLWETRKAIVVEGAADVWRFKGKACGTLGTGYTAEQVRLLARVFDKLVIMFDPEPLAQVRAEKLKSELSFRGVKTFMYNELPDGVDPGKLHQDDADYILKELKL